MKCFLELVIPECQMEEEHMGVYSRSMGWGGGGEGVGGGGLHFGNTHSDDYQARTCPTYVTVCPQ